jgi:hypothetical protein
MAQVNTENTTAMPAISTRRRFLSQATGVAAGGTVLALANSPALAGRASGPPGRQQRGPALRAAAVLDDAHERLKAAAQRLKPQRTAGRVARLNLSQRVAVQQKGGISRRSIGVLLSWKRGAR